MILKKMNLETVTPMFLHGSSGDALELRPPPFKSLMRYWWRTVQDCQTQPLREAEAKLFGSTDGKAPFSIRISGTTGLTQVSYQPLPHRTDRRGSFHKDAYKAEQLFDVLLIAKNESEASTYKQIAKLGFLLGGVGNRSRRGFGSIRETRWDFTDVSNLRSEILDTLNSVANADRFRIKDQVIAPKRLAHFPPEYPVIQRIYLGNQPTDSVDSLLKKIGLATHEHKHNALGGINPRLASPIHVRIQKVGFQYVPVITQLHSIFPKYKPEHFQQKQENFINTIIR